MICELCGKEMEPGDGAATYGLACDECVERNGWEDFKKPKPCNQCKGTMTCTFPNCDEFKDAKAGKVPSLMPALYSHRLGEIQDIARGSGYAIAVHGSMQRDLDLIAVPWVERAVEPKRLVARFCSLLHLECDHLMKPEQRPHGRQVWTLMMGGCCFMDLSVIPLLPTERGT